MQHKTLEIADAQNGMQLTGNPVFPVYGERRAYSGLMLAQAT